MTEIFEVTEFFFLIVVVVSQLCMFFSKFMGLYATKGKFYKCPFQLKYYMNIFKPPQIKHFKFLSCRTLIGELMTIACFETWLTYIHTFLPIPRGTY